MEQVKQLVMNEFHANALEYCNAGIDLAELQRYLSDRQYTLDAVDAILDMLCNATGITAFIIGEKYIYRTRRNVQSCPT